MSEENAERPQTPPTTENPQVVERSLAAFLASDLNSLATGVAAGVTSTIVTAKLMGKPKGNDQGQPPPPDANPPE